MAARAGSQAEGRRKEGVVYFLAKCARSVMEDCRAWEGEEGKLIYIVFNIFFIDDHKKEKILIQIT